MLGGYMGKILWVDLTTGQTREEPTDMKWAGLLLGGSGLAAKYLWELTDKATDPLGPANPLIFMAGPLTGTKVPLSGRHAVVCKSPLTGIWGEADVGGTWGTQLKRAGYDGLIVTGAAARPVYIWVSEQGAEIRDAARYWGRDTYEIDAELKAETHPKAVVSAVGQGGENLVLFSGVMTDGREGRAAARCGVGAVMGSKRLKAVVAYGTRQVPVHDAKAVALSIKEYGPMVKENAAGLHKFGTIGGMIGIEYVGDLPIKNWVQGSWEEGAKAISGQRIAETILTRRYYCGACIIGCGRVTEVKEGKYASTPEGAGPEYESGATLGALCLVDDLEAVNKATDLCNRFGLDTIGAGSAVAFGMECYEHGLITRADAGYELKWGDADAMLRCLEDIALGRGIGKLLGQGTFRAGKQVGGIAEEFSMHVKGMEFPAHDPRAYYSLAVGYATSNRGACHLQGLTHVFERSKTAPELGYGEVQDRYGVEGKGVMAAKLQNFMCLFDAAKLCKFLVFGNVTPTHVLIWINAVTGLGWNLDTMMKAGERMWTLKRMYNNRLGITRKDDTLPKRILTLDRQTGGAAGHLPPLEQILEEYYRYRDWTPDGRPSTQKIRELGLEEFLSVAAGD